MLILFVAKVLWPRASDLDAPTAAAFVAHVKVRLLTTRIATRPDTQTVDALQKERLALYDEYLNEAVHKSSH